MLNAIIIVFIYHCLFADFASSSKVNSLECQVRDLEEENKKIKETLKKNGIYVK